MPSHSSNSKMNRKQAPQGISRWPGAAVRIGSGTRAGQIDYRKGRVNAVTQNIIKVEMDHPLYPLVVLAGDSYIHVCKSCKRTMTGIRDLPKEAGAPRILQLLRHWTYTLSG